MIDNQNPDRWQEEVSPSKYRNVLRQLMPKKHQTKTHYRGTDHDTDNLSEVKQIIFGQKIINARLHR